MDLTKLPDQLSEIDDEIKELSELVPYAKHILKAYKWAKKRRMIHFLKTLNEEIYRWDEKQKEKLLSTLKAMMGLNYYQNIQTQFLIRHRLLELLLLRYYMEILKTRHMTLPSNSKHAALLSGQVMQCLIFFYCYYRFQYELEKSNHIICIFRSKKLFYVSGF